MSTTTHPATLIGGPHDGTVDEWANGKKYIWRDTPTGRVAVYEVQLPIDLDKGVRAKFTGYREEQQ